MRSRRRGAGSDIAGSRPYRPGDDVRRIDWRASARLSSARSGDEFVVREHLTEEAARVVLLVDRRRAMALFPAALPWLRKPRAIAAAGSLIVDSAVRARCLVGCFDHDGSEHPRSEAPAGAFAWQAPDERTEPWQVQERYLSESRFLAPDDFLARALEELTRLDHALPDGTFVFLLSDFLVFPPRRVWSEALARRWDIVPVVIQDPVWEQSFPDVAGGVLPLADPSRGRVEVVRLTRGDVLKRRRANEARLVTLLDGFDAMGLDHVLVSRDDPGAILNAFLDWAAGRSGVARLAR